MRAEFTLSETPAPQRLSPFAAALGAEPSDETADLASGRFVLLHDPDGVAEWGGEYRIVVFARSAIEPDMLGDPMIHDVGWSWVRDALETSGAHAIELGGTVTSTSGRSFGTMADRPGDGFVEIRASWTAAGADPEDHIDRHVAAWGQLLAVCSGLPPVPEGVTSVPRSHS